MALSFLGGMAESFGESLDEQHKYIRAKRAKDRDFLMTYGTQAVTGAKSKVNEVVTTGMQLEAMGLPKEDINFIVETSGPLGLTSLYDRVKDFTPDELSPEVFQSMIKRTKDFTPSGTSYQQQIEKAFGLYKANVTNDPVQNESNAFMAAMGLDPASADSALEEQYMGGYTGRDIKRIMGTAAPGLTGPLGVDFSVLPKTYTPRDYAAFTEIAENKIEVLAADALFQMAPSAADRAKLKTDADNPNNKEAIKKLQTFIELEKAIKEVPPRYDIITNLVPLVRSSLLDFDKATSGGLYRNPTFLLSVPNFRDFANPDKKEKLSIEVQYARAFTKYPFIETLDKLKTYNTYEEGLSSKKPAFIVDGQLRISEDLNVLNLFKDAAAGKFDTIPTPQSLSQTVVDGIPVSQQPVVAKPVVDVIPESTSLTQQMLSLDIPDTEKDNDNKETNPFLTGWTNISDQAMADLTAEFNDDYKSKATSRTRTENDAIKSGFDTDKKTLTNALENVRNYIEADGNGAPEETLKALALKMTSELDTAPEDVQQIVMSLIQNLEDGEFPDPQKNFGGQFMDILRTVGSYIPKGNNAKQETISTNDPADVVAMGDMPYTELAPIMPSDISGVSREFMSFDNMKNELKLGNLKEGDIVKLGTLYFKVHQQGLNGEIGNVKVRRDQ